MQDHPPPSTKFIKSKRSIPNRYIVQLHEYVVPNDAPLEIRRARVAAIANSHAQTHGGKVGFIYETAVKGYSIELPNEAAAIAISNLPEVKWVEEVALGEIDAGFGIRETRKSFSTLRRMFEYDRKTPLDMREIGVENRDTIQVHDLSYASPKGGRVTAYLVVPAHKGKFAGIIFMHARPGSRTKFLDEALSYARLGAVSLLIDAPFSRGGESKRDFDPTVTNPDIDRDIYIQTVVDLRRGVDLLLSCRDIDPKRIGFIGHSFGAHTGVLLASVEKRIKSYVIMAGAPSLTDYLRTSTIPGIVEVRQSLTKAQQENYFTTLATVDPINYVHHVAPSALFFQFGKLDTYPTEQSASRYFTAASDPKSVKWYDTGHALNDEARRDRASWLQKQIGLHNLN